MAVTHDIGPLSQQRHEGVGPQVMFATALLLTVATWVFVERAFTSDHSLPLVTTLLFGLASLAALVAWTRGKMAHDRLTYWDVAGALTFVGIGTAALIDAEQMLRLVESGGIGAQDLKTSDR